MYNDILLPDDEAWTAVTADLRQTKESRNALSKENSYVIFDQLVYALNTMTSSGNSNDIYQRSNWSVTSMCYGLFSWYFLLIVHYSLLRWRKLLRTHGLLP